MDDVIDNQVVRAITELDSTNSSLLAEIRHAHLEIGDNFVHVSNCNVSLSNNFSKA